MNIELNGVETAITRREAMAMEQAALYMALRQPATWLAEACRKLAGYGNLSDPGVWSYA